MAAPAYRSAGTMVSVDPSTSANPPLPAGWQIGDVLVLASWAYIDNTSFTGPAGWTQFASGANFKLWWKRAGSGESAPTLPAWGGEQRGAQVVAYSGCKTSGSPFDSGISSTAASSAGTAVSTGAPGSTTAIDALISAAVFFRGDVSGSMSGWANASLTSVTERTDGRLSLFEIGFALATGVKATAGSVSAFTGTLSPSMNWSACAFALLPDPPPISGSGSATLPAVTGTGSSAIALAGTASKALPAITSAGAAAIALAGSAATSIGALASTGAAALAITAAGTGSLGAITSTASAALPIKASGAVSIGEITADGEGEVPDPSTIGGRVTSQAAGRLLVSGQSSAGFGEVVSQATAKISLAASVALEMEPVTSAGSAKIALVGNAGAPIEALRSSGTGTTRILGEGTAELGPVTSRGQMGPPVPIVTPPGRRAVIPISRRSGRRARY